MEKIKALLESEEAKQLISENDVLIEGAVELVDEFKTTVKEFVMEHVEEFIGETLDDTIKNIRVFSEVCTAQYMYEISNLCSIIVQEMKEEEIQEHNTGGIEEYI